MKFLGFGPFDHPKNKREVSNFNWMSISDPKKKKMGEHQDQGSKRHYEALNMNLPLTSHCVLTCGPDAGADVF